MTTLTMPADFFCPTCGVHNRKQDAYAGDPDLMPECPVCADKRDRGEISTPLIPTDGSAPALAATSGGSERGREAAPSVGFLLSVGQQVALRVIRGLPL